MRARLLIAALGLAFSCGTVRNSDVGSLQVDAGMNPDAGFGQCTCQRGICCGDLCCQENQICCQIGGAAQCVRPFGVNTTCADFGG
jgi:hypothetical protein